MNRRIEPPVLVGEQVIWLGKDESKSEKGVVKWIGNLPELSEDWCIGIELDKASPILGGNGFWKNRKLFECRPKHGVVVPVEETQKISTKSKSSLVSGENSQIRDITKSNFQNKISEGTQLRYSKDINRLYDSKKENQIKSETINKEENDAHKRKTFVPKYFITETALKKKKSGRKNSRKSHKNSQRDSTSVNSLSDFNINEIIDNSKNPDFNTSSKEFIKTMNEISGYFKEIKEGDDRFERAEEMNNSDLYVMPEPTETGHSKPKKLFSFLKWFNKKQKHEPNLKLFQDTSAASSPVFPRRDFSSCESIDTFFSTQTVRSFAYIPPTQYVPSAPPLEIDKSSYDNVFEDPPSKPEETESIYERKKKRKAPEPPRLSRENSLPSTLEHKKPEEDFDGIKTFHRRTVSESFKDKKAGAYYHVQGKRKAPPPPKPSLYPNLQKLENNQTSLQRKKRPAPPPPENPYLIQNSNITPQTENKLEVKEIKKEKPEDLKEGEISGKEKKINQMSDERSTQNASSSPLPSRPWYKRSHRDSTGSNIIRKDLLRGFDKKKNKETDDWMPEVGFPRKSLSTESGHSKFNIFSKLERTEDKKKEEKRKSQISILTNISELDREAAEIVKKEQAEEKKMLAANDAKYYSTKDNNQKMNIAESPAKEVNVAGKSKPEVQEPSNGQNNNEVIQNQSTFDQNVKEVKKDIYYNDKDKRLKAKVDEPKKKENNLSVEETSKPIAEKDNTKAPDTKDNKLGNNSTQTGLNHFNVEKKELNYLNEPWVCEKCTLENPGWRVFCEICKNVKTRFCFNKPLNTDSKLKDLPQETKKPGLVPVPTKEQTAEAKVEPKITPSVEEKKEKETKPEEPSDKHPKEPKAIFNSNIKVLPQPEKPENSTEAKQNLPKIENPTETKQNILKVDNSVKESFNKGQPTAGTSSTADVKEDDTKRKQVEKPKINLEIAQKIANEDLKPKTEEVAEAYVLTKTIVLEDIIIKKPERGKKVSASVQTKSSLPTSPNPKVISPPPRTKKIVFDAAAEKNVTPKEESEKELEELTNKLTQAQGLADFRANIETMPLNTEMNTVAVNRLLRQLETAINSGDHFVASGLAKELALMKINCSVRRQPAASAGTSKITIDLYIEDKISHQGPIPLEVSPLTTLLQLKKKVQQQLGIPLEVQRWILGKKLATDDNKTLEAEGVTRDYSPVFLYLVAPGNRKSADKSADKPEKPIENPNPVPQPTKENPPENKTKGWYYNYEEDHYSYCEDSEDDNNNQTKPPETKETTVENKPSVSDTKEEYANKTKRPSIFDLKIREAENDAEKELKLVSANSVKQKVEKLNKTFEENSKVAKPPLRSSKSPESWKCGACYFVNASNRISCSSCNTKKVINGLYNKKVEEKKEPPAKKSPTAIRKEDVNIHYKALMELQDSDLVPNSEPFNCSICLVDYEPAEGVTLKDCLHTFCRTCLVNTVQYSEDAEVKCPYLDDTYSCPSVLQQREIKALVPKGIFELHLAKSVKEAENKIDNAFHCKTPDCKGWCIFEDNVNEFHCPVCKTTNCLTCQAIHTGINCREFQERMKDASETDVDAKKTKDMLNEMVEKGEAMACPKCQVVLMKKWGCDWLRCSMCKTEICWVTRGFRWGPEGKGDTSGGCKCGVNGVKCHPKCNYCH